MWRRVVMNVVFNTTLTVIFLFLNQWALQTQLEETVVALALVYGCIVIVGNALFISSQKAA